MTNHNLDLPFWEGFVVSNLERKHAATWITLAVAMDMNTAFDLEVQQHYPAARVVYDLFHVIAKYGREVIDRVRVDEANRLKQDRPLRRIVKRARWLLLRNRENVPPAQ